MTVGKAKKYGAAEGFSTSRFENSILAMMVGGNAGSEAKEVLQENT